MNAVEIEQAVSALAEQPFDAETFPYAFLEAFGNKATTIKRLKSGTTNHSDIPGGVLQRSNIHLAVCAEGEVADTLTALRDSPATAKQKAKFIAATDGATFEAENLADGETVACDYADFPDHFGFFLPLAGITTVKEIRENAFDIKATSRLNRLYVELLKDNPDWATDARRPDMNHFMARLIFCFFAEDTDIFVGGDLFTATVEQMSEANASNTDQVISELFRAMNTALAERQAAGVRSWANVFPYVNGGLFSGSAEVPHFSRMNPWVRERFAKVKSHRSASARVSTQKLASVPFRFGETRQRGTEALTVVPSVSSENRQYLPVGFAPPGTIVSNLAFALFDAPLWNMALIASRIHLVWIATVCGKLETRYRYSNTLGWNTFPVPPLTDANKADLTGCAEDILLAREAHFPATIAELYDPEAMPDDLRAAHERNDETLERIYIGRRFKNDPERLEKLFELCSEMTAAEKEMTA